MSNALDFFWRLIPLLAVLVLPITQATERERLVLAGPPASVSYPLIHMIESGALGDVARHVEFVPWTNPDQLRALVMQGQIDFIAAPTNVAANLYNREVPITLLNVATWGALWMVSREPGLKTLADFKGKEIALPFRADMPDIVFSFLAERQGLDPHKDFRLRYTATPMDAVQLLVMRRVDHALLAEPAVSMVLRKTRSFPVSLVAPEMFRSVDLQAQWGELTAGPARIPQAGLAALGNARQDPALLARIEQAYEQSASWCFDNAADCGAMVARRITLLTPEAIADSLQAQPRYLASAAQAKDELEAFFQLLLERQPATLGGKLPDAGFYGGAAAAP
ncbi:ABC transporter substrate-binding protein [Pseudomonas huaxiensis]|uniref:ABC transporter substrate-binding protein n=1 Tax=Pseudomonas huaxiensis TaxID=2213017 RepID=UPI000DA65EBD|nr:PhnD/SsuA/transferrin family substrate-binding protein [Pseudomonas huaxiensis]